VVTKGNTNPYPSAPLTYGADFSRFFV